MRGAAQNLSNAAPLKQVSTKTSCPWSRVAHHCASPPALTTFPREIILAAGRFAAGHLGGLTPFLPFELVDAVLAETRAVQRRLRDLPSRVGVCFLIAMCLFPEVGYKLGWDKMTGALDGRCGHRPRRACATCADASAAPR